MTALADAIALIDETLPLCSERELYSTDELSDLLLDIRQYLIDEDQPDRIQCL